MAKHGGAVDPSLVKTCKRSKEVHRQYRLGMGSWTESSIEDEKENLTPNGKSLKTSNRWSFITDQDKEELSERHVPKNTEATTKWALANFNAWRQGRNEAFACDPNQQVPSDLLQFTDDSERLCKWLTLYVAETRKQNGSRYPSKTIYSLLTGLLQHARAQCPRYPNFLNTDDATFQPLHNALDNLFRNLRKDGVDSESKSAEVFTKAEEGQLWERGILGTHNPKALLRAVFS